MTQKNTSPAETGNRQPPLVGSSAGDYAVDITGVQPVISTSNQPRRKRTIDYAKKIMNDPFLMKA